MAVDPLARYGSTWIHKVLPPVAAARPPTRPGGDLDSSSRVRASSGPSSAMPSRGTPSSSSPRATQSGIVTGLGSGAGLGRGAGPTVVLEEVRSTDHAHFEKHLPSGELLDRRRRRPPSRTALRAASREGRQVAQGPSAPCRDVGRQRSPGADGSPRSSHRTGGPSPARSRPWAPARRSCSSPWADRSQWSSRPIIALRQRR